MAQWNKHRPRQQLVDETWSEIEGRALLLLIFSLQRNRGASIVTFNIRPERDRAASILTLTTIMEIDRETSIVTFNIHPVER